MLDYFCCNCRCDVETKTFYFDEPETRCEICGGDDLCEPGECEVCEEAMPAEDGNVCGDCMHHAMQHHRTTLARLESVIKMMDVAIKAYDSLDVGQITITESAQLAGSIKGWRNILTDIVKG